jgi:hypothetical protein
VNSGILSKTTAKFDFGTPAESVLHRPACTCGRAISGHRNFAQKVLGLKIPQWSPARIPIDEGRVGVIIHREAVYASRYDLLRYRSNRSA